MNLRHVCLVAVLALGACKSSDHSSQPQPTASTAAPAPANAAPVAATWKASFDTPTACADACRHAVDCKVGPYTSVSDCEDACDSAGEGGPELEKTYDCLQKATSCDAMRACDTATKADDDDGDGDKAKALEPTRGGTRSCGDTPASATSEDECCCDAGDALEWIAEKQCAAKKGNCCPNSMCD